MRQVALAILFAAPVVAQAPAAKAQFIEFAGSFVLTKLNQTCIGTGCIPVDHAMARSTRQKIGDNASSARLSRLFTSFAENYTLPRGQLTSNFKIVHGTGTGWGRSRSTPGRGRSGSRRRISRAATRSSKWQERSRFSTESPAAAFHFAVTLRGKSKAAFRRYIVAETQRSDAANKAAREVAERHHTTQRGYSWTDI